MAGDYTWKKACVINCIYVDSKWQITPSCLCTFNF